MKKIKSRIIYGTKSKEEIEAIFTAEVIKLYKQGRFENLLKECSKNFNTQKN